MTNEELQAKVESIKSFDDAYKMACEGGYTGTAEEFMALVEKAADEVPMDLNTMDDVSGASAAGDWLRENRALVLDVAGNVGVALGTCLFINKKLKHNAELRSRDAGNQPANLDISEKNQITFNYNDTLFVRSDFETWSH